MSTGLLDALERLSQAHGAGQLLDAFRAIRQQVWKKRREAAKTDGKLAAAYLEIVEFRDQSKAAGTPADEINRRVEAVLRDVWLKPKGRTEPWRYHCDVCDDTGLVTNACNGQPFCGLGVSGKQHDPHTFGRPCSCHRGRRFMEKSKASSDPISAAAKVAKPTSRFTR